MPLFDVYPLYDVEPAKARGVYIYDQKGNKYLDLYGGHARHKLPMELHQIG